MISGQFTSYNGTAINNRARLYTDGSLDTTFNAGVNSYVNCIAIQSDGKIITGGTIARLNTDGSSDTTFNTRTGANGAVYCTAIQSDGKIIIGGLFTYYNGTARNYIARLNTNGSLDTTFNPGSGADSCVRFSSIQSDGKIIIVGDFTNYNGTRKYAAARLNTDGSLDTTFNPGLETNINPGTGPYCSAIQSDGKIIFGGGTFRLNGTQVKDLARLNTDGSLDTTFTGAGPGLIFCIAIQSDGKIVIGGWFPGCKDNVVRIKN